MGLGHILGSAAKGFGHILGAQRRALGTSWGSAATKDIVSQPLPYPAAPKPPEQPAGRMPGSPHSKKLILPLPERQPI